MNIVISLIILLFFNYYFLCKNYSKRGNKFIFGFFFVFTSIILVIFAEIINTAIEKTLDLISQENNHAVELTKDMMAAAVLLTAIGSLVVAFVVFVPRIIELIQKYFL